MKPFSLLLLLASFAASLAARADAQTFAVSPELWDRPRTGQTVLAEPAVRQAVAAWLAQSPARLAIRHAAGQELPVEVEELRAWLVALGVEAARITLRGDLRSGEPIRLEVARD